MAAQIAAWDEVGDQRSVFLDCCRRMTEAVVDSVDRGRFEDLINVGVAETADLVQDEVIERRTPWLDVFDRGFGRIDERLAVRLLTRWRTQVWRHAIETVDDPACRDRRVVLIEQQCARRARWLLV